MKCVAHHQTVGGHKAKTLSVRGLGICVYCSKLPTAMGLAVTSFSPLGSAGWAEGPWGWPSTLGWEVCLISHGSYMVLESQRSWRNHYPPSQHLLVHCRKWPMGRVSGCCRLSSPTLIFWSFCCSFIKKAISLFSLVLYLGVFQKKSNSVSA